MRVASDVRRSRAHRREIPHDDADRRAHPLATQDELADQKRAREMLDEVLDAMEMDTRAVFVLFELEGLTTDEIVDVLALPRGTVASRLRRAREEFRALVKRRVARSRGGAP